MKLNGFNLTVYLTLSLFSFGLANAAETEKLEQHRQFYQQAKKALADNNTVKFNFFKHRVEDYSLYPYLEYAELSAHLWNASNKKVQNYLTANKDIAITNRLRYQWLNHLQKRDKWRSFLEFYRPSAAYTKQECYYQLARYRSGEKESAIEEAIKLWSVGKSQPKECDKLFGILVKYNHITEDIAWQRYSKAVLGHQYQLARYLQRFFTSEHYQQFAKNFYSVDRNHRVIGNYQLFNGEVFGKHSDDVLTVIVHGITHLARQDARKAMKHWSHYQQTHQFRVAAKSKIVSALVKGLYQQDFQKIADGYLDDNMELVSSDLLEWRARKSLAKLDWKDLSHWISVMPEELQQDNRWRYWQTRTEQALAGKPANSANDTYQQLSLTRSHYGFLSSGWLNSAYSMAHQSTHPTDEDIRALESNASIIRTRELLHHGEYPLARREWRQATKHFSEQQWITAAHLTREWKWYNGSINSMIKASFWNDTELRFPLAYRDTFSKHATATGIPLYLLMALARQESAMSHDVTSPAGAKGLMQLMPATAKQTARKNGVSYKNSNDLFTPETNITLGSRYYKEMLDRFDNNRILATAAYNAGPHRVDRWLKESDSKLPFDVWIEIIPFRETRGYVENVLAFSMIYAHRLKNSDRMLRPDEMSRLL